MPSVSCDGKWGVDFTFHEQGCKGPAAVISNEWLQGRGCYSIKIDAHRDVLFYLSVALAIDKLNESS